MCEMSEERLKKSPDTRELVVGVYDIERVHAFFEVLNSFKGVSVLVVATQNEQYAYFDEEKTRHIGIVPRGSSFVEVSNPNKIDLNLFYQEVDNLVRARSDI